MTHIVAAGHPTQCQNSQGTIQQEEIKSLLPDCLSPKVSVPTKLIFSVHLICVGRAFFNTCKLLFVCLTQCYSFRLFRSVLLLNSLNPHYDLMLML